MSGGIFKALLAAIMLTAFSTASHAAGPAWLEYGPGLAKAAREKKPALVEFSTGWCRDCKKMEKNTFADPDVVRALDKDFVPVKVDGDKSPELISRHKVLAYPTFIVLDAGGKQAGQRLGYMDKNDFLAFLRSVKAK